MSLPQTNLNSCHFVDGITEYCERIESMSEKYITFRTKGNQTNKDFHEQIFSSVHYPFGQTSIAISLVN